MDEMLQEYVDSGGLSMRVDRPQGVIRGVKILGLESRNGRSYAPHALREAISLYEGAKVNVNHPKGNPQAPRDYQDRIGVIRGVRLVEEQGLFGDLHFNPKHVLADQLAWDAEHAPENVGFSHNVQARQVRKGDRTWVEAILRVQSVDLVADPTTTQGLFESTQPTDLSGVTLNMLRESRPDLVTGLLAESAAALEQADAELAQLRSRLQRLERERTVLRLLQEHALTGPDESGTPRGESVSAAFFATLIATPDDRIVRALVEEHARLISPAWGNSRPRSFPRGKPTSRDQQLIEPTQGVISASQFAAAIRSA